MKQLLASLLFASTIGLLYAEEAKLPPAPKEAPAQKEAGTKANRPKRSNVNQQEAGARMVKMIEQRMANVVKEYDKDNDGKLNDAEKKAMLEDLNVNELEKKLMKARTVKQFQAADTDGDGVLSDEERKKAPQAIRETNRKATQERMSKLMKEGGVRPRRNVGDNPNRPPKDGGDRPERPKKDGGDRPERPPKDGGDNPRQAPPEEE